MSIWRNSMKEKAKRRRPMMKKPKSTPIPQKNNLATILVLVISALLFLGMFLWLHPQDILKGKNEIFNVYRDEMVEFEKATVKAIPTEEKNVDEFAEGAYVGTQELTCVVKSGRYKGEIMTV